MRNHSSTHCVSLHISKLRQPGPRSGGRDWPSSSNPESPPDTWRILFEQRWTEFAVAVFKEHIPPIVSTLGYVVWPAGQNHPPLARHTSKVLAPPSDSQDFGVMVTVPDLPVPACQNHLLCHGIVRLSCDKYTAIQINPACL